MCRARRSRRSSTAATGACAGLLRSSPLAIPNTPHEQTRLFLSTLYHPGEFIFSGRKEHSGGSLGITVRTQSDWLENIPHLGEHISIDPLTGQPATNGGYRNIETVAEYRHILVEFDNLPFPVQLRFWCGVIRDKTLPIQSLVYNGGKSFHALLRADCQKDDVRRAAYIHKLHAALCHPDALPGNRCDPSGKSRCGLTRLPGIVRYDTKNLQNLLWLSPRPWGL